jgi:hypothetical protein
LKKRSDRSGSLPPDQIPSFSALRYIIPSPGYSYDLTKYDLRRKDNNEPNDFLDDDKDETLTTIKTINTTQRLRQKDQYITSVNNQGMSCVLFFSPTSYSFPLPLIPTHVILSPSFRSHYHHHRYRDRLHHIRSPSFKSLAIAPTRPLMPNK